MMSFRDLLKRRTALGQVLNGVEKNQDGVSLQWWSLLLLWETTFIIIRDNPTHDELFSELVAAFLEGIRSSPPAFGYSPTSVGCALSRVFDSEAHIRKLMERPMVIQGFTSLVRVVQSCVNMNGYRELDLLSQWGWGKFRDRAAPFLLGSPHGPYRHAEVMNDDEASRADEFSANRDHSRNGVRDLSLAPAITAPRQGTLERQEDVTILPDPLPLHNAEEMELHHHTIDIELDGKRE